jgi:hypothetical protein
MGNMGLFDRDTPDGYPEGGTGWISAGTLAERIRFVQTFMMSTNTTLYAADATAKVEGIPGGNNNISDPIKIIQRRLNDAGQDDPVAIANLFLDLLFLGEGKQNLDLYRSAAVRFLNTTDAGITLTYSSRPATGVDSREERVRGMVAMLMALPRFNEQ